MPGPSRISADRRRRDHHRPARGRAAATASAWRSPSRWLAAHFNRPGFALFDYDVYAMCGDGDMMEGISQRSGLARRPSQARQPVLDLRQQPHHHRRPDRPRLQRRCRRAVPGLRLARRAREGRQRHRRARQGLRRLLQPDGRADDDHRRQPHRLRRAEQAGHRRRARRAAGRGRDPARPSAATAGRRMRSSSCPTACASISTRASAGVAPKLGRTGRS